MKNSVFHTPHFDCIEEAPQRPVEAQSGAWRNLHFSKYSKGLIETSMRVQYNPLAVPSAERISLFFLEAPIFHAQAY
ncbi:hypothetical protein [Phaeobacter sp. CECT 5382]|uniref:hypothetical protein n=1 Tax=Phaeobacter sp. CECT 5382 TaxID=1712645 RepID=UPI001E57BAC4|nr:hypothetical protein [Phaeobacter sp. CECT 5382]